jgi:hypothetical protein
VYFFGTGFAPEPLDIGVVTYRVLPGSIALEALMSRKLTALLLAMLVLAAAMGLKTVVTAHSNGTVMMANGSAPFPPAVLNGSAPFPPARNGSAPFPPARNGSAPFPPATVSSK